MSIYECRVCQIRTITMSVFLHYLYRQNKIITLKLCNIIKQKLLKARFNYNFIIYNRFRLQCRQFVKMMDAQNKLNTANFNPCKRT